MIRSQLTLKRICDLFNQVDVSAVLMNHDDRTWVEVINVDSFVFSVPAPWTQRANSN